jgi:hypothetical protein
MNWLMLVRGYSILVNYLTIIYCMVVLTGYHHQLTGKILSGNDGMGAVTQDANFSNVSLLTCKPTWKCEIHKSFKLNIYN